MTQSDAARKHGVKRGTIAAWLSSRTANATPEATQRNATQQRNKGLFDDNFLRVVSAALDMLEAWAVTCSDPEFIRANPEGVNVLGQTVIERCDRIVAMLNSHGTGVKPRD